MAGENANGETLAAGASGREEGRRLGCADGVRRERLGHDVAGTHQRE
jgi:hypothetical protein